MTLVVLSIGLSVPLLAAFHQWTSNGPDGGKVQSIAIDPSSPNVIYAGSTNGGVSRSLDGGASWESIPSSFSATTVRALATHASLPGVVFAGTDGFGAYRSLDYGETWTYVAPVLGPIEDIVIDPSAPATVYAAGAGGVSKSVDGGDNWSPTGGGLPGSVFSVVVDPSNSDTLYAGTSRAVYKSVNGGLTWFASSSGIINAAQVSALSVAIDPATPTTLLAGTGSGTYRSVDGAGSWVLTSLSGVVYELRIDPSAPASIYAGTNFGVKYSADAGANWTGSGPQNQFVFALAIDPSTQGRVYTGTDGGGVYRSEDSGATWSSASFGMNRCGVNAVAVNPTDPAKVYAGTEGTGVARSEEAGDNWLTSAAGITLPFVKTLVVHPAFPLVLYAGVEYAYGGGLFWSADGGANWFETGRNSLQNRRIRAVAVDSGEELTVLAAGGFYGIYRSTDNGTYWQHITDGLPFADVAALAFDPSGNGIVYVATAAGVYKSFDHGVQWQPQGLADVSVRSLAVDPFSPETLYAGIGYGAYALYKSETGGLSWAPADTGLSSPIHAVVVDPTAAGTLYAAGNGGVFVTTTGGASWAPLGNPFEAPGVVTSLAMDGGGNILHAGTSARGVAEYQLHFFDAPPGSLYRASVETLASNGISPGCGAGNFCVASPLTRAQASVWLLRAVHGPAYLPSPATGTMFPDVPADAFAAAWIEALAAEGIAAGCGAEGFCPGAAVTRAQLAVWLLRAKYGPTYAPAPASGLVFADVAADSFAADWIEALAAAGISAGCGGGNFCPGDATSRGQAAALLVRTFELM